MSGGATSSTTPPSEKLQDIRLSPRDVSKTDIVIIDKQGDILLKVGGGDRAIERFCVGSKALARCSSPFENLLVGNTGEADSPDKYLVTLPGDAPEPMRILLLIAHGRNDDVPESLSTQQFFELVELASRYDMIAALHPWLQQWINPLLEAINSQKLDLLGFIAWETGSRRLYEYTVKLFAKQCAIDEYGNPLHPRDGLPVRLNKHTVRTGFYDYALKMRGAVVREVLFKLATAIQNCLGNSVCQRGDSVVCPLVVFESLTKAYEAAEIDWETFRSSRFPSYRKGLLDLASSLMSMKYDNVQGHDCNPIPSIQKAVAEIWKDKELSLAEEDERHFEERAMIYDAAKVDEDARRRRVDDSQS
ncbi:nuclear pore protein-like protein [Colletotrichum plurivorum]|uniref:Nuclear pore protein-like protein n=1 Tax=Colletotrichum plurivorum TaxID=2175906 RepID=A0A8H6KR30_9PEZI|nr:nuclear pore protein-like protein [Colletotrichum plurivorum]